MELLLFDEKNERYISTWKINQIILKEELDTIKANQSNDFENSVFPIFNVELEKTDESINQKPISNFFGDTSNEMKINYENKYLKTSTKKYPHPLIMYFMDELLKTVVIFNYNCLFIEILYSGVRQNCNIQSYIKKLS